MEAPINNVTQTSSAASGGESPATPWRAKAFQWRAKAFQWKARTRVAALAIVGSALGCVVILESIRAIPVGEQRAKRVPAAAWVAALAHGRQVDFTIVGGMAQPTLTVTPGGKLSTGTLQIVRERLREKAAAFERSIHAEDSAEHNLASAIHKADLLQSKTTMDYALAALDAEIYWMLPPTSALPPVQNDYTYVDLGMYPASSGEEGRMVIPISLDQAPELVAAANQAREGRRKEGEEMVRAFDKQNLEERKRQYQSYLEARRCDSELRTPRDRETISNWSKMLSWTSVDPDLYYVNLQ